ncbi:MAG: triose-phosphate isomerase [Candidatus Paceibacterota bacterium]
MKDLVSGIKKRVMKITEAYVVIAPPVIFTAEVAKMTKSTNIILGAQNTYFEDRGPFTGEVSPALLAPFGVEYVIVGHSERRAMGETDEQINKKIHALLKRKLTPIVCIGEKERDKQGTFFNGIESQIRLLTQGLTNLQVQKLVIAYEPIWAIGTGATATADDVKEMQIFIVSILTKIYDRKTAEKVRLLYGGSVKSSNAEDLHKNGGMNGFLVGGASLQAEEFVTIIKATISTK